MFGMESVGRVIPVSLLVLRTLIIGTSLPIECSIVYD